MKTKRNLKQAMLQAASLLLAIAGEAQINSATPAVTTAIAAGNIHSLFVYRSLSHAASLGGDLYTMGYNQYGQLGMGTNFYRTNQVYGIITFATAVAAGNNHSLFIRYDGSLWGMGDNEYGQLGDDTTNTSYFFKDLAVGVTAVAAGSLSDHSLFIKNDGSLWAMGRNQYGQLGDGTVANSNHPEQIRSGDVIAVAAGTTHSLFIVSNSVFSSGGLFAMGNNQSGQLGDGTTNNHSFYEWTGLQGVKAIAAGFNHSLFLKNDGSLWGMGDNSYGELGAGSLAFTNSPIQIVASNVVAIAAGVGNSFFIKTDGSLWAMGNNSVGELGDGTQNNTNHPEQIVANGVAAISAGGLHSLFVKTDGSLWGMGNGFYGQLGGGTNAYGITYVTRPVQILAGAPPALGISTYGGQPAVFYPTASGTNYVLQMTTNLGSGNWVAVSNGIPINGLIITNPPGNAFFRLH